jgi:hypothetical protein
MKYYIFDIETYSEIKDIDDSVKKYSHKEKVNLNSMDRKINFGICIMKELNRDNWMVFENRDNLKQFLLNKKHETHVFIGHNILNFDIFTIFDSREILDNFKVVLNGSQILQMYNSEKNIYFFDTYNIYKTSLKELGRMLNMEKGNLQQELKVIEKDEFFRRKGEIIEYCKNDVLITEKVFDYYLGRVSEIKNIKKVKSIPFTSAMYSFTYFNYLNSYKLNGRYFDNDHLFLESYYGGRTENFFTGKYSGIIYVYDVNSLYSFAMKNYEYPMEFYKEVYGSELNDERLLTEYINAYEGLALVKVKAGRGVFGFNYNDRFIDIGLLPLKRKMDYAHKLIFPLGEFYGIYNLNEIRHAMKSGYNFEFYYLQLWKKGKINKIDEFIDHFYELKRAKRNTIEGFNAKVILNSLYGKFVQNEGKENIISEKDYIENMDKFADKDIKVFENYIIARDKGINKSLSSYFNIGSYISSWARIYMLENMNKIIKKGGKIFYMDTDSLFTDIELTDGYFIGDQLGKFKLENISNGGIFYGAKSYKLENKNRMKGISRNSVLIREGENELLYQDNRIIKLKQYLNTNIFYDKTILKKLRYTSKRQINGLNAFSDALNVSDNILFIQKQENAGLINKILNEVNLNLNIMGGLK